MSEKRVRKAAGAAVIACLLPMVLAGSTEYGFAGKNSGILQDEDAIVVKWHSQSRSVYLDILVEAKAPARKEGVVFAPFQVVDDGAELADNQVYTGVQCNLKDSPRTETISLRQPDGSGEREEVSTMELNNIVVSVPKGGTRAFGVPVFSTEYYAEGEQERKEQWHDVEGEECPEFDDGIDTARKLIREGYFQKPLEDFLLGYPELEPESRQYRLILTGGGRTDREEDDTSWWGLDYVLVTTAENGETVAVAHLDITKVIQAQGYPEWRPAEYRIWSAESGYWRLLEDPVSDGGKVWISQVPEMDFSKEETVRAFVEEKGADFDLLLPAGADRETDWSCHREEGFWYDYLVWSGTTDTYELTLAIPLMEEEAGGWYMASRIRKEAADKERCLHTLDVMRLTFHEIPYVHIVKEGESLWSIYLDYGKGCLPYHSFGTFVKSLSLANPDRIYPGQEIRVS